MNAETQRNAEKRRENEASAVLCDSLRLCVSPVLASIRISKDRTSAISDYSFANPG